MKSMLLTICIVLLSACASGPKQPILYPNNHLNTVGQAIAQRDIAECRQLAMASGVAEKKHGGAGKQAATGAAIGGASAGAWGLVRGDAGERAAAGAAAGAAGGLVRGGIQSTETSPVFKSFVQQCLRDRGYQVIGWQ